MYRTMIDDIEASTFPYWSFLCVAFDPANRLLKVRVLIFKMWKPLCRILIEEAVASRLDPAGSKSQWCQTSDSQQFTGLKRLFIRAHCRRTNRCPNQISTIRSCNNMPCQWSQCHASGPTSPKLILRHLRHTGNGYIVISVVLLCPLAAQQQRPTKLTCCHAVSQGPPPRLFQVAIATTSSL